MLRSDTKVLVTGGTGFTGSCLVRRLCELGCQVRVIARPTSPRAHLEDDRISWFIGDVVDQEVVARACEDVQYIFHVAAAYRIAGLPDEDYRKVHVSSTKWLARQAVESKNFQRFVHVSTVGVHGHIRNPPADESTPFSPGDIYQVTKAEAELWITEFASESGLPLTVIRPTAIYGWGDTRLLKLFRMAKWPLVPLIGDTRGLYHLIHVEDLVSFMIHAAQMKQAAGQIYICGSPEPTSIRGIIETVGSCLGRRPRFVRVPAWPFFTAAYVCEKVCRSLGIPPLLYPRRVAFFTKDRAFNTERMRSLEGFQYRYNNETGIAATCESYRRAGDL